MSTRCHIVVYDKRNREEALLYRHSDGYPGKADGSEYGVLTDIVPFVKEFIKKRGYDAEYLAARLLQHLTNLYDNNTIDIEDMLSSRKYEISNIFGVLGYGICGGRHPDIEYEYRIKPGKIEVYETNYWDEDFKKAKLIHTEEL